MKLTPSFRKVKRNCFTKNKQLWASISLLFLFILATIPAHANTIDSQRKDYLAAKKTGIKCLIVGKKFVKKGLINYKNLHSAIKFIYNS